MDKTTKYLLVDAEVLPEVFHKVVSAKQMLAQGKAKSLSEAVKQAELSRSAFYKYKDRVFLYQSENTRRIATIYASLLDESGVLSSLLFELYRAGANILTINQNIPVDGVAPISVSVRTDAMREDLSAWIDRTRTMYGIVEMRLISN